eukprot:jgi/Mesvir1/3543/Mv12013-RA.1
MGLDYGARLPGLLCTAILVARFLHLEREDGVGCLRLALWAVWWTFTELMCVVRLIIYYPELLVAPVVHVFLQLVCAVMRLVRRISQLVGAMLGAMAGTREFCNIMVALFIAAIVIVAEIATVGYDGIVFALCKPDIRLELGAAVGTVGWYILLGFWNRTAHCPWQQCSTQVWTSQRSTMVLRCYRLPRHPGIVRRLTARHRPMRRRRCARRLAWATVPLFGACPRKGPCARVRCIIRRRLPRPLRSAWRPTRYPRAVRQRGPGPARQSRQQRRRMRALAAAMCWCPRPMGGRGELMYDGDCEIPLAGEHDLCVEGGDSDVDERLEVTGDWDESYCGVPSQRHRRRRRKTKAAPALDARDSCACGSPCVATTSTQGSGPTLAAHSPASPCVASSPQPAVSLCHTMASPATAVSPAPDSPVAPWHPRQDSIGGGLPPCAMARAGDPRPRAYLCVEQADCLVGNPSAWVAFVRGKIDELVNAAPDKFSDNIYYAMLMLQARVGPVVPWPRSASETLLVTSIQNNLRYWETLRVQMERQGCYTMTAAPVGVPAQPVGAIPMGVPAQAGVVAPQMGAPLPTVVAGRKFQSASSFLEAALACDGSVGERLVTVEHYLRMVEGRRDVLYAADYEPAPGLEVDEPQMGASAAMTVDVTQFTTASEFADTAFTGAANVWERLARIQYLLNALEQEKHRFSAGSVDAAMKRLKKALHQWEEKWSSLAEIQKQRLQSGYAATTPAGKVRLHVRPAVVEVQGVPHVCVSPAAAAAQGGSVEDFKTAVEFVDYAKTFSRRREMSVEEKIARLESLLEEVRRWNLHKTDAETIRQRDMADVACEPGATFAYVRAAEAFCRGDVHSVEEQIEYLQSLVNEIRRRDDFTDEQRRTLGKTVLDMINARVQPAVPGIIRESADPAGVQAQGNAGRRDAVVNKLNAQRRRKRNPGLSPPGSDGKRAVDDVAPVTKETQRQKNKRENDEMKKFGMTLAEVRRLSRCLDTGDYAGFGMRPFKLRPLTNDPSAVHPYSLDEHRERSKCPKCHAPMFKEEEPKGSRCCSKGKAKVLEPNLNLIIEKRRRRERLLAEANADERELARNELTHQEEMLWQIHCNPTNVALWIRYGRMINQFFAVARVVASGRIGDSVKNKGACVLELHGQTVERIKPIIRDGVHVNNDFFFLLDKPGKDEAQEDVLKRCEVKERDPNLRKLLDLLEEYLLTYNPLLQQFARQATEELEQRQASVEVAGQFSPEVHAPEIFLLPRWVGHGYGPDPWLHLSLATVHCCMH